MTRFALRSLGVAVGLVLVAQVPLAYAEADTLRMAGLSKPVEIIRDRWGIPHIYARNEADLFFAQGYNAARDRLFQFEIWRRQATGTTAEILGR
ncbi:MAG: penicillin acylase family protein, partial [Gemmatimonadetes bacterium]|nr:penicillin acylase family protein [Gemmatimonadota bacterium]